MERARVPLAPLQPSPLATQQARPRVRAASRSPSRSASTARRKKAKPSSLWKQVVNLAFWGSPQTQQHEAAPEAPMDEEPAAEDDEEEVDVDAADSAADSSAAGTAAAKPRRPHRKKDPLPNLPAEFAVGRESLGPLQHTEGGRAKAGEKQDVVVPHGHVCEADGEDSDVGPTNKNSKLLPDGSKPYRIYNRLTVKAHQRAENFA